MTNTQNKVAQSLAKKKLIGFWWPKAEDKACVRVSKASNPVQLNTKAETTCLSIKTSLYLLFPFLLCQVGLKIAASGFVQLPYFS